MYYTNSYMNKCMRTQCGKQKMACFSCLLVVTQYVSHMAIHLIDHNIDNSSLHSDYTFIFKY